MECGSNLQSLILSLLEPIKRDPEGLIQKAIPNDKMKMYYMVKGILPKLEFMFGLRVDPNHLIIDIVSKIENVTEEKWQSLETLLRKVLDGDQESINHIKKLLEV